MKQLLKYKKYLKTIFLVVIFAILTINITKNIIEISAVASTSQTVCVPIFMYHQVKNGNYGKDVISPSEFQSDLKYLAENNYTTITMTELIDFVYNGKKLPEKPIILSFDDGYLSTYKYVFPLLKEYNMKIVLSIIGKGTEDFSKVEDININYSHVTWDQVIEMHNSGLVEIQNHSYDLHKVCSGRYGCGQKTSEADNHYEKVLMEDVYTLQNKIKLITDHTPNTFTYPYGKYNENTEVIMKKLGFKATLTIKYGVNLISTDKPEKLFGLKRICRAHNQNIKKLIKDGIETLKYLDEDEK
jgi:peptidoglycan/xylan/chitin deacetylase (PgdA/CDA1 family)